MGLAVSFIEQPGGEERAFAGLGIGGAVDKYSRRRCRETLREAIGIFQILVVAFSKGWKKCPFLRIIQRKVVY